MVAVSTLLVQLVLSVLSMPVTPLCWLYATRQLLVEVRALASTAPALWAVSFMILMPGLREDLPGVLWCVVWPASGWYVVVRTSCIAMTGTILVCSTAAFLALLLRWGRRVSDASFIVENGQSQQGGNEASGQARAAECSWQCAWLIRVVEAVCVEIAWRAYLLPRLLLVVSLPVSLGVVGALSAASALPVALSFVQEHFYHTDIQHHTGTVIFFYMIIVLLQSVCLAWLAIQVSFCIWPAAVVRLYWPTVLAQVSGIRSLTGLTDLSHQGPGYVRGPRWKASAEGAVGIIVLMPLAFVAYHALLLTWEPAMLNNLFPHRPGLE